MGNPGLLPCRSTPVCFGACPLQSCLANCFRSPTFPCLSPRPASCLPLPARPCLQIEGDEESKKALDWVREMYAFSVAAALEKIPLDLQVKLLLTAACHLLPAVACHCVVLAAAAC